MQRTTSFVAFGDPSGSKKVESKHLKSSDMLALYKLDYYYYYNEMAVSIN